MTRFPAALLCVLGLACTKERLTPATLEAPPAPARQAAVAAAEEAAAEEAAAEGAAAARTPAATPRKLIHTGELELEVERFETAAGEAARVAQEHGGYVADRRVERQGERGRRGSLTLRVDAGRFEDALGALRRLGEIERESVAAQDITKAYTDLETRVRVKREAEGRLRDLLRTRAGELEEILAAERELARITEEIELLEGERRFYDHQVALSTITLGLHEPEALVEPSSFAPLAAALSNSLRLLALSLAALFSFAVAAAPWLLVLWLLWRVVRRLRRGRGEEPGPKE